MARSALHFPVQGENAPAPTRTATVGAYFRLTKPRVIELLLVTAVPPMFLAEQGVPPIGLIVAVVVGGAFAAGGANTINCWIERDRDQLMRRTHGRPLPAGEIAPERALVFGIVLNVIAFALLAAVVNLLAATLTLSATLFYVFVYTIWLKPRTVQNIVIGGAAGAVPALVGWAAIRGDLAAPAWILFAVVFAWTPAHFWALALSTATTTRPRASRCCRSCAGSRSPRSRSRATR
jgi:protoheme IX farnesyltransferase